MKAYELKKLDKPFDPYAEIVITNQRLFDSIMKQVNQDVIAFKQKEHGVLFIDRRTDVKHFVDFVNYYYFLDEHKHGVDRVTWGKNGSNLSLPEVQN